MGDKILKKTFFILLPFLLLSNVFANDNNQTSTDMAWVDAQINAIAPARQGVHSSKINNLKDPFIYLGATSKKKKAKKSIKKSSSKKLYKRVVTSSVVRAPTFTLEMVMNHSARIDGKWYHQGMSVHGYTLQQVDGNKVLLAKGKKSFILTTKTKNRSFKFNNN